MHNEQTVEVITIMIAIFFFYYELSNPRTNKMIPSVAIMLLLDFIKRHTATTDIYGL